MRISDWSSDVCSSDLFQLPNIFRRLFAEGAFAAAFIPLFNQRMTKDGDQGEARAFAEAVLAVLIPVLIVFSALLLIIMPWVMGLFASDALRADGATFDLAVLMARIARSEEHTSELQSLMRISYAVFCLKKKKQNKHKT